MLEQVEAAVAANDERAVSEALYGLASNAASDGLVSDEIAFEVIGVLRRPQMHDSPMAGHVMNFFHYHEDVLSRRAQDRFAAFLREWGGEFSDLYAIHVIGEFRLRG